jgi:hypothetical protein
MGGTSAPYIAFPYGGGHIPPSPHSLDGAPQQPVGSNMNYNLFEVGSLGPSSYTTPMGSMLFSLFGTFGNNSFSSAVISTGGNPGFGKKNPVQGSITTQGENTGSSPYKDSGIHGKDQFPHQDSQGKPLPWPMEPWVRLSTYARWIDRGKLFP